MGEHHRPNQADPAGQRDGGEGRAAGQEVGPYVPELKKFYTSNSGDNTIGVVDMTMTVFNFDTHTAIAELPLPAGPDVIKFDAGLGRIYVACSSGAIAVFQMDDAVVRR